VPQASDTPPADSPPQRAPAPLSAALTHRDSRYNGGHDEREEDAAADREALLAPRQAAPPALAQHLEEK